jgi:signal peptidase II
MQKKQLYILILIFSNFFVDQFSKYLVRKEVTPGSQIEILGEILQLMNVENSGAFLGMGSDSNPTVKLIFLLIIPALVLTLVTYQLFTSKSIDRLTTIGLSCIVGGGLANLYDRFLYGSVTDFLFMDFNITRTGIFNTADLSVTTGLILILLSSFKDWRKNSTNSN